MTSQPRHVILGIIWQVFHGTLWQGGVDKFVPHRGATALKLKIHIAWPNRTWGLAAIDAIARSAARQVRQRLA